MSLSITAVILADDSILRDDSRLSLRGSILKKNTLPKNIMFLGYNMPLPEFYKIFYFFNFDFFKKVFFGRFPFSFTFPCNFHEDILFFFLF